MYDFLTRLTVLEKVDYLLAYNSTDSTEQINDLIKAVATHDFTKTVCVGLKTLSKTALEGDSEIARAYGKWLI